MQILWVFAVICYSWELSKRDTCTTETSGSFQDIRISRDIVIAKSIH
jgi:hypothetical protein